ncbi:hypothetical protein [Mycobacterium sp. MMS18-G62]
MGSRVRIAAAACFVASGLMAAGAGATLAFAEPGQHHGGSGDNDSKDSSGATIHDGLGHEHDGSGQVADKGGNEDRPGVNGTTPGVGPLPGGTGNEHSGNVGSGKTPAGHDPGTKDDQEGDQAGGGQGTTPPTTKPSSTSTPPSPPPEQPGCDKDNNDDHCNPGWPWWPWPWPWEPGQPPGPGGGGGGGGVVEVPSGRPKPPPEMQLPPELKPPASEPAQPGVVSPVPGVGVAAAELPIAPLTLPVVVAPPAGFGGGAGGAPNAPTLPGTPRGVTAEPPAGREPLPASVGSNIAAPASSYRTGYGEYLRTAGLSQVAAMAVPGITGILVLTSAGGLVGYRQARAGHAVRTGGTARFMN